MHANQLTASQMRKAFWLKQLRQWHWISSAICLIGMLLFALTGITLNHAAQIEAHPAVTHRTVQAPAALTAELARPAARKNAALPAALTDWLQRALAIDVSGHRGEWSDEELYIALPRPGGDAWVSLNLRTGVTEYELTTRGWISYINDLHKGRSTGVAWRLFLDGFAGACFVFSLSGLLLLKLHAGNRLATWPMVGLGLVVPLLIAILFIH